MISTDQCPFHDPYCIAGISKYSQGNVGGKMVFKDVLGEHAKTLSFVTNIGDQIHTIIWIYRKVE